jgi:hypothetical protein
LRTNGSKVAAATSHTTERVADGSAAPPAASAGGRGLKKPTVCTPAQPTVHTIARTWDAMSISRLVAAWIPVEGGVPWGVVVGSHGVRATAWIPVEGVPWGVVVGSHGVRATAWIPVEGGVPWGVVVGSHGVRATAWIPSRVGSREVWWWGPMGYERRRGYRQMSSQVKLALGSSDGVWILAASSERVTLVEPKDMNQQPGGSLLERKYEEVRTRDV